ncbi:MAG: SDR family oxidoreductase [Betaproteobacteria bacterium]|nr:MAG: SDR family oxidoreductase [Betaproteobacteria bacterium]
MSALLKGKTAIVTGAAGGIGRVLVDGLLEAGANVVATDVNDAALGELEKVMFEKHPSAGLVCQHVDVADYTACVQSVQGAIERFGRLHILINNAGLGPGIIREDHFSRLIGIQEIEPEIWQRIVAVNFTGAWNMTRAAIGHLLDQQWGRIINVTTSFFTMLRGGFHPYGPSKAGLESMSLGHSQEFEGSGVTVNVVVPGGPTDTLFVPDDIGVPRSELIAPSVMVAPIVWLCSDAAQEITGNRYVAAQWDTSLSAEEAEKACRAPAAWPQLGQSPVWPGGKPSR